MKKPTFVPVLLVLLILLGVGLRIAASRGKWLWQDEAETTINSLQVLERGFPYDLFKGKPLFENRSFIASDDPKYAFQPTNYAGSNFERNKGWLTFYYEALFLKIFGFNTWSARLPFAFLFAAAAYILFLLGSRLFSRNTALASVALYSVNYYSIIHERQARYFTLEVAVTLFCLLACYNAITSQRWRWYLASSLGIILLFSTHIPASIAFGVLFLLAHILYSRTLRTLIHAKVLTAVALVLAAVTPWAIMVRLWNVGGAFGSHYATLVWFAFLCALAVAYVVLRPFMPIMAFRRLASWTPATYLLLACASIVVVKPLLTPPDSVGSRLFVELNPIALLLFSSLGFVLVKAWYTRTLRAQYIGVACTGLALFFLFNQAFGIFSRASIDTDWVKASVRYLDGRHVNNETPVLVSYQQFPFLLYSNYNVDLVWPLRKSFIDSYSGTLFIVLHHDIDLWMFYRDPPRYDRDINYADRLKTCVKTTIAEATDIYECPALR